MIAFSLQTGREDTALVEAVQRGMASGAVRDRPADAGERAARRALPGAWCWRRCARGRSRACPRSACTARTSRSRPAACCATRSEAEAAGFDAGMSLGPLLAVERAPGRVGLRLVVPRRGAAGDGAAVGRRQRPRPALPPGDRRPGGGDAVRAVPGPAVGRARHGRVLQRAHHRRRRGRRSGVRNARLRECVDVMRALFAGEVVDHDGLVRVDRARLWTLPAEPPALVGAAVSPGDGALVRRLGRRARDDQPAARAPRAGDRGVPRGRRRGQADPSPGAPVVGADRRGGAARSRTTSGARTSSRRRCAGTSPRSSSSTRPRSHVRPEDVRGACSSSADLGAARRVAAGAGRARRRLAPAAPRRAGPRAVHRRLRRARAAGAARMSRTATGDVWWKNAVVYCLDVETFLDGDGDGCGDLAGPVRARSTTSPASA